MGIIKMFLRLCFLFFSLLLLSEAARIDLSFKKMQEIQKKNYVLLPKIIKSGLTHSFNSKHFTVYWGDKVPATDLWVDYNKNYIPDFIENVSSILESVWNKEINELSFNKPLFDHIDVYIANTEIYINGKELTMSDNVCGYAVYNGDEEYIVVNNLPPSSYYTKAMDILRVTLAHEFFHLVQYSYSLKFKPINTWLYEGTAVLMERVVFPKIPDYIYSYASTLTSLPEYGLIYPYDLNPYSASLFFDFITNKYSLNVIKKIWNYFGDNNVNSLEAVDKALKDYNSSLKREVYNFYDSLENNLSAFSNWDILSNYKVKKHNLVCDNEYTDYILPFGAIYTDDSCAYRSFANKTLSSTFSIDNKNVFQINQKKMVVVFSNELNISSVYYDTLKFISKDDFMIDIKKGWNLIGFKNDVNASSLDQYPIKVLWAYKNGKWKGYSQEDKIKSFLDENNMSIDFIQANSSVWILANEDFTYTANGIKNGEILYKIDNNEWNLIGDASLIDINLSIFSKKFDIQIAWSWDSNKNKWQAFSNNEDIENILQDLNISKIEAINSKGVWVKK